MTDPKTPQRKDYTFGVYDLVIANQGVQGDTVKNGRDENGEPVENAPNPNAGKAWCSGTFKRKDAEGKEFTIVFKAFDEATKGGKEMTPASKLLEVASGIQAAKESGAIQPGDLEVYLKGSFVKGREKTPADDGTSKGNFQDFKVSFVDTIAEHEAFKAANAKKKQGEGAVQE